MCVCEHVQALSAGEPQGAGRSARGRGRREEREREERSLSPSCKPSFAWRARECGGLGLPRRWSIARPSSTGGGGRTGGGGGEALSDEGGEEQGRGVWLVASVLRRARVLRG